MYKSRSSYALFLALTLVTVMLTVSACSSSAAPAAATLVPSSTAAPAETMTPASTDTPAATPTPGPSPTPSGPFPIGSYKPQFPLLALSGLTFVDDGTYTVEGLSITGTYVVTNNQIVFTEKEGGNARCVGIPGTYIWSFDGTTLRFKRVDDQCADRSLDLVRSWIKQP